MKKWLLKFKCVLMVFALLATVSCDTTTKLPEIPGVKGPQFNILNGKIIVTLKLLKANLPWGGQVPIPETANSALEVSPNLEDGGTLVVFHIDVEDLKKVNIGNGNPNTLPDGRAIPGIPGGELTESLRLDTELLDTSYYFHKKLFGIFMPIGWDTRGLAGYWPIDIEGKNYGTLGAVASDNEGRGAGVLIFFKLDSFMKNKKFKRLLKLSKMNPKRLY